MKKTIHYFPTDWNLNAVKLCYWIKKQLSAAQHYRVWSLCVDPVPKPPIQYEVAKAYSALLSSQLAVSPTLIDSLLT